MTDRLLIWGAGGHGKVILDIARHSGLFETIFFVDDDPARTGLDFCGCPVIGGPEQLRRFSDNSCVIAVGNNRLRERCWNHARTIGLLSPVLVHPNATVAASASLGPGTVVMAGAVVNPGAVIGGNCIVNTGAIVEHDCRIGNHAHLSPRVVLGGAVTVGAYAHVGIGAVVLPGAEIGAHAIVGAGSVVLKHAPAGCTVIGVPSKVLVCA